MKVPTDKLFRANQEKYFYAALRKYHTDQLENYQPSAHHAVTKSNSDHHHNARHSPTRQDMEQLPSRQHKRTQSGYSILNNEHLYSKHSFYESPASEASYDPFRASKQPIIAQQGALNANVTVHRGHSNSSKRKPRPTAAQGCYQTASSLRVKALRNNSKGGSASVSRGSSNRSTPSNRSTSNRRKSISRSSLASSHWPSSPPVIARSSGLGKRGVSFSHLRDRRSPAVTTSIVDYGAIVYKSEENTPTSQSRVSIGSRSYGSSQHSTSCQSSIRNHSPALRSKSRTSAGTVGPRLRVRKPESPTKYIQSEARKVSTELGKVMEEAFNRSSISSSRRTSATELYHDASQYDTPPTSFSNSRDSGGSSLAPNAKAAQGQRPLPPIPVETPNTFLHRKLAETRAEIAQRLDEEGENTDHYNEVLENLDRLMMPAAVKQRIVSAPAKSPEHPAPLHVIPEEKNDADGSDRPNNVNYRAVTDPVRPQVRRAITEQQTIRLVEESPTRIAPLNIQKRSGVSIASKNPDSAASVSRAGPNYRGTVRPYQQVQNDLLAARTIPGAAPIDKENIVVKKKKSMWFRRNAEEKEGEQDGKEVQVKKRASSGLLQISEAWQGLDDRVQQNSPLDGPSGATHMTKQSTGSGASEFPMRNGNATTAKSDGASRKGLFGFFGKKSKEDKGKRTMELGSE